MKLSKLQKIILGYGWFYVIYFTIWNFIVYTTSNPYNCYGYGMAGTSLGGVIKALSFLLSEGIVVSVSSILIWLDNRENDISKERVLLKTDYIRIAILGVAIFFGLPWIFAIHGIFISDIPGLNAIFMGAQIGIGGNNPFDFIYPSVHLGNHHGFGGLVYIIYTTLFSILVFQMENIRIKQFSIFAIGSLFSYGLIGYLEDYFHEQIIKRGLTPPIWHIIKLMYDNGIIFA